MIQTTRLNLMFDLTSVSLHTPQMYVWPISYGLKCQLLRVNSRYNWKTLEIITITIKQHSNNMVNWMSENTNQPCIFQNQMVTVRTVNLWSVIVLILGWTEINETEITVELPPCGQKSICVCVCVKQIYEHQSGLTLIMHNLFSKGFSRTFVHSCRYFPVLLFFGWRCLICCLSICIFKPWFDT